MSIFDRVHIIYFWSFIVVKINLIALIIFLESEFKLKFTSDMLWEVKVKQQKTSIKSYEDIIDAVSKHFGIEKEWILWDVRKKEFMIPRQVAMYLLKTKMNYTYERIWNIFSWRNHAAVLYSCNKLDTILKTDKDLLYEINVLREWIWL